MLRVITNITFNQQPTADFPTRNGTIIYNFCHEFEVTSTWDTLTDDGSITLPKNVYVTDQNGKKISLGGRNVNLGGFGSNPPVFLRGDKVSISWGYAYFDNRGNEVSPITNIYTGFISQVTSKKPFVLQVEDNMYLFKRVKAIGGNNGFFAGSKYTVEKMLAELIANGATINPALSAFTVNTTTSTVLGDFTIQNETIAEVLARLRKQFHFEAYFKGNELRCGSFVYLPSDALIKPDGTTRTTFPTFTFQQNIISDDLDYKRKDDLTLSAVATNTIEQTTGAVTRDGHQKTKKIRLEVLVTFLNGSDTPSVYIVTKQNPLPPNENGGERRTLHFLGATTTDQLVTLATNELKKYYYTGYKGKFTTFGIPFVKTGDNVQLVDPVLPEREGLYKVKSVNYRASVSEGLKQDIQIDYKII